MGVIYQDYISCQAYSQCTIFGCLGVLPEVLYHFCGSAPTRVVRETCLLIREYSQCLLGPFLWEHSHKHGIAVLGVLPKTQNNYYWEYSQTCLKSGRSHIRNRLECLQYRICTHVKLNTRVARDRALSKNLSISPPQLFCIVSIKREAEHRSFGNSDGLNQVKLIDVTTG